MKRLSVSVLADPLDKRPIGGMVWMMDTSGWTDDKIARLGRLKLIPGAFQAQPGKRGAKWSFRKAKVLAWLESLETK
jgi:hypothetical protein